MFPRPGRYTPEAARAMLEALVGAPGLALLIDVDALERSALARVDRVMQLALAALGTARTAIMLAARYERDRAATLQRSIPGARFLVRPAATAVPQIDAATPADTPVIALSDDPAVFDLLAPADRGLALGRPELARPTIASIGDASVRATVWWLYERRARAIAS